VAVSWRVISQEKGYAYLCRHAGADSRKFDVWLARQNESFVWGERFGGFTVCLEPGIGIGRFRARDAETDSSHPELGAGFIVQAGLGAEFYIPIGVDALPLSLEATYRLVVPLNQPAESIHGVLGTLGFRY
jgi:hypothetical protein